MATNKHPAAAFDRSQLTDKTRVFQLAKALGVPSKELIVALTEMGLVKVAQSSLTRAEAEKLLDALSDPAQANHDATSEDAVAEVDEKIRQRVRKDVENEIHQIEEKVERELPAPESDSDELLTNIEPEITPAPESDEVPAYVPVFKAPSREERRRARRASSREAMQDSEPVDSGAADEAQPADEVEVIEEPKAIRGSSRLEAQRRRRSEKREEDRKRSKIVSQAEFLARRESVERTMVVRERARHSGHGTITQVGVLEDGVLAEHFVTSDQNASMIGNIYLGRVQNVLPSMEAAFIDIGQNRNGVLYAGEVDWKAAGLGGRSRRIEQALKSGDQVMVQVTKDPVGHKGARLTTQISLAGRYLVYVPGGRSAGISRKLPAPERKRLKEILAKVVPGKGGAIIRTAAEGVSEEAIAADVTRLHNQWEALQEQAEREKSSKGAKPVTLYEEPNLLVKVVRDLFNEDFSQLIVDGKRPWNTVHAYVSSVAPDLEDRLVRYDRAAHDGQDAFEAYRVDEQIQKALSRTVWLPSGGTLVIDRTEAMTVIDVNTGKFTGSGGSLEETVTRNNLEAAEEIVRQMRLRDIGGMIIVDFIDMILPENQELVLRRLKEALGRDRTRHQVSEVTSLGLVQMTRKRLGTGLLETFSTPCECCGGRGIIVADDPVDTADPAEGVAPARGRERPSKHTHSDKPAAAEQDNADKDPADHVIALDEEALDKLAASVIGGDTDSDGSGGSDASGAGSAGGESRPPQPKGRRRGRRGGSRGRGKDGADAATGAAAPGEKAAPEERVTSETFDEAVEEFENSPRRKRRTRGNSRSDYRPKPEDFWGTDEPAETEEAAPERTAERPSQGSAAGRTRGRRRAVRRSTASASSSTGSSAAAEATPTNAPRETGARGGGVDKQAKPDKQVGGRGRRRAVRRRPQ
ncbi:translation initiation factor IF-2 N-terminal domain-containing protein [Corynebacterium mycetoides]|uniref:translation initiation factor IF-2 N-terminal domain-containing protein n=1 Tax=Corynebacterium mycetoides TaxID=38302 RepID=UPI000B822D2B|nr:translation initiation factor IF-2 N-terminal domain-containing protein [Corynebacterium mycetoides]